uniref:uncharacterized protein LOC122595207 isoform X3 n=1 Tax=Erigeron canadensis TaxID=72917 RepID=UPI001CB8979F|nr:uncharacterized protein LOC122595207 isoform X3 [Erigeron canadensis]
MEDEMISLCNIMPVELAIKREMEYRKKMEALNSRNQNELAPLMLAQVPVSESQTLVDRKRKVEPCNAQCSRRLLSSPRFVCVLCRIAFANVFHLKRHGETSAHRTAVGLLKNRGVNHAAYFQEFEAAKRARIQLNLASSSIWLQ